MQSYYIPKVNNNNNNSINYEMVQRLLKERGRKKGKGRKKKKKGEEGRERNQRGKERIRNRECCAWWTKGKENKRKGMGMEQGRKRSREEKWKRKMNQWNKINEVII